MILTPAMNAGVPDDAGELDGVAQYYAGKLKRHGATPLGVDWTCQPTQELRFVQFLTLFDAHSDFSLNDFGCGYGALRDFLGRRLPGRAVDYRGVDIAPEMIAAARKRWAGDPACSFVVGLSSGRVADFSVASGIFNVKLQTPAERWTSIIRNTLLRMHEESSVGLAFNVLATPAAGVAPIEQLYTTTPGRWRQWLRRRLGLHVTVRQNYGMREFTVLALRRPP